MDIRKRILYSFLALFLFLTFFLYPALYLLSRHIQKRGLEKKAEKLIVELKRKEDEPSMISLLKSKEDLLFFRMTLITSTGKVIFDSHDDEPEKYKQDLTLEMPEVEEAFRKGEGYGVRQSPIFDDEMAYMATAFTANENRYVLRISSPFAEIKEIAVEYSLAFLIFNALLLLLFGIFALLILQFLTKPLREILHKIGGGEKAEWGALHKTFESLSKKVEEQVSTLLQERNEKEAILESLEEGVIAIDEKGEITYVNQMAELFLNIHRKELVGKSYLLLDQKECIDLIKKTEREKGSSGALLKTGTKPSRYLDLIAVPRKEGGVIVVLQDKTGLHKIIEKGRDFVANASHELKTPITIIRGFAETLHDHPELTKEVSEEITEKIVNNCERMETLTKNLLTLASLDEGLPDSRIHECDLVEIVQKAIQTVMNVHPDAEIKVVEKAHERPYLWGDAELLYQAVLNLLDNAAKYSKGIAHIEVTIDRVGDVVSLKIKDKGIGIPADSLDRVFERFYSVDKARSKSLGGSGLGLSIVESIVERHKGKIVVDSKVGEGTTFTLTFPIAL